MAHREREGEAEDDACLACPVVTLFRELFEEVVAAGDPISRRVTSLKNGSTRVRMLRSYSSLVVLESRSSSSMSSSQYDTSAGKGLSAVMPEKPGWKRSRSASFFFNDRSAAGLVTSVVWTWRLFPSQSRYLVRAT